MRLDDYFAHLKRTKVLKVLCWVLAVNAVISILELILKYLR